MKSIARMGLFFTFLTSVFAASADVSFAQTWGTIKGQVVFAGASPTPEKLKVNKDEQHCLSKGDILSEKFVVDPKSKGVRWVMVWLVDSKNPKAQIPIHPSLLEVKQKDVVLDQPCCVYEPHVIGM